MTDVIYSPGEATFYPWEVWEMNSGRMVGTYISVHDAEAVARRYEAACPRPRHIYEVRRNEG
jgi:hypothetical protein